ncbi:MAG TPA: citrate synthase, partial [Coriobacteriia bacterium]|nr:citrate synthase [Coriobacteriia bacterium]
MAEPAPETTRPTSRETTEDMLQRWSRMAHDSSIVEADQYSQYDVKRGLRHVSGKGVIAGLTQIGDVVGSSAEGDTYVPIPGELIYRGISINDLVHGFLDEGRLGFEETAYLVLFGELPNAEELRRFESQLAERRNLPRHFIHDAVLRMPSRDIMNAMSRGILALYTRDIDPDDISMPALLRQSLDVIAATPLMAVYAFQAYVDQYLNDSLVIHRPNPELGTAENILHMLRRNTRYTALEARVLDLALVLHAEHGGGNNSSFTAHVVSSTGTDTYATIAASLGSLKGPRHGGANIKMVR